LNCNTISRCIQHIDDDAPTRFACMRVVVDDGDIHLTADVSGEGPLIVCHPGFGRWGRDFESVRNVLLTAGRRVALFDPRGVGESTGPLDDLTMHDLAADLLRVARQLAAPPFDFVGHAFGNRVVRCAAANARSEVGRIALIGAGGAVPGTPEAYAALQRAMNIDLPRDVRLEALRLSLFAPGNDPTSWLDGWHATAIATQGAAVRATPEADWADAGTAQVLVVQGLDDALAPPVNGRELVARLGARATLVEVTNAGHAMLPEQPLVVANALIDFFGSH
jgi:pimeloyl-ACP methyl ester carboxylesterase